MEDSALVEDRKAGAHRTLTALVIMMSVLFVGSLLFMVLSGDQRSPEGRRVLAVLPVQGSNPETVADRFAGFGEGLAAYFGRADPVLLLAGLEPSPSVCLPASRLSAAAAR